MKISIFFSFFSLFQQIREGKKIPPIKIQTPSNNTQIKSNTKNYISLLLFIILLKRESIIQGFYDALRFFFEVFYFINFKAALLTWLDRRLGC